MKTFSYSLAYWELLLNFGWLVNLVECPDVLTTNCNLWKGQFYVLTLHGDVHQLSYPFRSLKNVTFLKIPLYIFMPRGGNNLPDFTLSFHIYIFFFKSPPPNKFTVDYIVIFHIITKAIFINYNLTFSN